MIKLESREDLHEVESPYGSITYAEVDGEKLIARGTLVRACGLRNTGRLSNYFREGKICCVLPSGKKEAWNIALVLVDKAAVKSFGKNLKGTRMRTRARRQAACRWILENIYGEPEQPTLAISERQLTTKELDTIAARLLAHGVSLTDEALDKLTEEVIARMPLDKLAEEVLKIMSRRLGGMENA